MSQEFLNWHHMWVESKKRKADRPTDALLLSEDKNHPLERVGQLEKRKKRFEKGRRQRGCSDRLVIQTKFS